MRKLVFAAVLFLAACGCKGGIGKEEKDLIKLEDVPAPAMKTAKEKAPNVNFDEAYLKKDGTYEVRGKRKGDGKVIEVEVKADGTFVALE
jgi:hypothetical protein